MGDYLVALAFEVNKTAPDGRVVPKEKGLRRQNLSQGSTSSRSIDGLFNRIAWLSG